MKIQKRRYNNAHTNRDKHNGASGAFGGGKRLARGKHMLCVGLGSGGRATLYDSVGQKYFEPHGSFVMGETKVSNGWNKVKKVYVKEETGWMELSEMEYANYFGEKELYKLIKEENK